MNDLYATHFLQVEIATRIFRASQVNDQALILQKNYKKKKDTERKSRMKTDNRIRETVRER